MKLLKIILLMLGIFVTYTALAGSSIKSELQALSPMISQWAEQSKVLAEVQSANSSHANYSKSQIQALNKQWQEQLNSANKPLISGIMNNSLSSLLQAIEAHSKGLYQGILITDINGLNIGQTYVPAQYWQAKQSFWKKAIAASPGKPYISEGSNKKGKLKPAIIALPIVDANGKTIGVVAVNIDQTKLNDIQAGS
ncbi:MAG: hypothetical protein K0Q57_83 [Gammaproteobacteria bacterium]|nr:hypothetical protein [Gammaproteobacteria bacterium]